MSEERKQFSEWAIIELFGHQRIAGRVSEQTIGGCAFVRDDGGRVIHAGTDGQMDRATPHRISARSSGTLGSVTGW
jgi:hypothetical protein